MGETPANFVRSLWTLTVMAERICYPAPIVATRGDLFFFAEAAITPGNRAATSK
jgi:hypothetical protein